MGDSFFRRQYPDEYQSDHRRRALSHGYYWRSNRRNRGWLDYFRLVWEKTRIDLTDVSAEEYNNNMARTNNNKIDGKDLEKALERQNKNFEKMLEQQANVILVAVDERMSRSEEKIKKEIKSEINTLANTLDKFLKRLTDFDDEFQIIKARVGRIEAVLQEKFGLVIN